MSLVSTTFAILVILALLIRYLVPKPYNRIGLLLLSYIFVYSYSAGSLVVLLLISCAGYIGQYQVEDPGKKSPKYTICIIFILLLLLVYNYFGFFSRLIPSAGAAYSAFKASPFGLFIPIGISFYGLSVIGSIVDSKKGLYSEKDILTYFLFAGWFPQILSGPIARARDLCPALKDLSSFDYDNLRNGLIRFVSGVFIKYTLADVLSTAVLTQYDPKDVLIATGSGLLFATVFYTVQIYADFVAYTWMVRGLSEMFGIMLNINFNAPYTSFSVREFWRRWHISLSSWLREYVYFSLGGSRKGTLRTCINTLVVFFVSGLWHGASFNYIVWGLLHGIYISLEILLSGPRKKLDGKYPKNVIVKGFEWLITFCLVSFAWIFFRSESLNNALYIISKLADSISLSEIFSAGFFTRFQVSNIHWIVAAAAFLVLVVSDICQNRKEKDLPALIISAPLWARIVLCYLMVSSVLFWGAVGSSQFIYFQF